MATTFILPGGAGPELTIERTWLGALHLFVAGREIPGRRQGRGRVYTIPLTDGTLTEITLRSTATAGLIASVGGRDTTIEPPIPRALQVLSALPVGLIAVGGLTGGLVGGAGMAVNQLVARGGLRLSAKVGAMLGVTALAVGIWLAIAIALGTALRGQQSLAIGSCLTSTADQLSKGTWKTAACSSPHDGEVVGAATYPAAPAYPGSAAIRAFAEAGCVGEITRYAAPTIDPSNLGLFFFGPDEGQWASGDRLITCVVLTNDGSKLTRSLAVAGA